MFERDTNSTESRRSNGKTMTNRLLLGLTLAISLIAHTSATAAETFWAKPKAGGANDVAAATARSAGAEVVASYPEALLVRTHNEAVRQQLAERYELTPLPDVQKIAHWRGAFDPVNEGPSRRIAVTSSVTAYAAGSRGLHLVQFVGPPQDAWLSEVKKAGAELVTYFPHAAYLARMSDVEAGALRTKSFVRWVGIWGAEMKFDPVAAGMRGRSAAAHFNVVLFNPSRDLAATQQERGALRQLNAVIDEDGMMGNHEVVRVFMSPTALDAVAAMPNVISVEAWFPPKRDDESSSLTTAGHYSAGSGFTPPSPTYASWLTTLGVDGSRVTVGVVDDGVDTAEVHLSGRVTNILSGASAGAEGHGHHVAGIVAGNCTHASDSMGYKLATGVAPAASILNQPFLDSANPGVWSNTCGTTTSYGCLTQQTVTTAGSNGSTGYVQNNSWGSGSGLNPQTYTSMEREYDLRVRDANEATTTTLEPLVIAFSAGNSGSAGMTRPKGAKNIITTGATDIFRSTFNSGSGPGAGNGCDGASALPSNNIDMMVCFSSYGYMDDSRVKPDVVAPGGNIASARAGASALWGNIDAFHRWCSGTSQASPHTAGVAALIVDKWRKDNAGASPSPAMVKAKIINSAVEIKTSTAPGASSVYNLTANLPNNREGWGRVNTMRHLNPSVSIVHRDQLSADLFGDSSVTRTFNYIVDSSAQPLYVTLAWTDAPAAINANPSLVNDLDLEITINGTIYKGNVLATTGTTGKVSVAGGSRDARNNVENVFIPTVTAGDTVQIRVIATSIVGDGVPANADSTDQDFALVAYNAKPCTPPAAPTGVTANANGANRIDVSWADVAGETEYRIYRSTGNTCPGADEELLIGALPAGTITYSDTTVVGGTTYNYRVASFAACESAKSTCSSATALTCTTPAAPGTLTATKSGLNAIKLDWIASATARVTYNVSRAGACDGTFTTVATSISALTWTDTDIPGGTTYAYKVFAVNGACVSTTATNCAMQTADGGPQLYSSGRFATATPRDTAAPQRVRWLFHSGAASLSSPAISSPGLYVASNDRVAHGVKSAVAGGDWVTGYKPYPMNGASQGRPQVVTTTIAGASRKVSYITAQDGTIAALDASTGSVIWSRQLTDGPNGVGGTPHMIQAAVLFVDRSWSTPALPSSIVIVGTRNASRANSVYGLNAETGGVVWTFTPDASQGGGSMGIVSDRASAMPARGRVFVASRRSTIAGGSNNTLWAFDYTHDGTTWTAVPTYRWAADLGDIDGATNWLGDKVYVGNNTGQVHVRMYTGTGGWSAPFESNDGPVKGFVHAVGTRLYFATTNKVWALNDAGTSGSQAWVITVDELGAPLRPSPLIYTGTGVTGGPYLVFGSNNGKLYRVGSLTGTFAIEGVQVGATNAVIGAAASSSVTQMFYVGSDAGVVYGVTAQ